MRARSRRRQRQASYARDGLRLPPRPARSQTAPLLPLSSLSPEPHHAAREEARPPPVPLGPPHCCPCCRLPPRGRAPPAAAPRPPARAAFPARSVAGHGGLLSCSSASGRLRAAPRPPCPCTARAREAPPPISLASAPPALQPLRLLTPPRRRPRPLSSLRRGGPPLCPSARGDRRRSAPSLACCPPGVRHHARTGFATPPTPVLLCQPPVTVRVVVCVCFLVALLHCSVQLPVRKILVIAPRSCGRLRARP